MVTRAYIFYVCGLTSTTDSSKRYCVALFVRLDPYFRRSMRSSGMDRIMPRIQTPGVADERKLQLETKEKPLSAGKTKPCVKCAQTTMISRLVAGRHFCANNQCTNNVPAYKLRRVQCQPAPSVVYGRGASSLSSLAWSNHRIAKFHLTSFCLEKSLQSGTNYPLLD